MQMVRTFMPRTFWYWKSLAMRKTRRMPAFLSLSSESACDSRSDGSKGTQSSLIRRMIVSSLWTTPAR